MKEIPLTQGFVALVDDEDYEWLIQHKWYILRTKSGNLYAQTRKKTPKNKSGVETMHRMILAPPPGKLVDHIDRNGLNNQRNNLRIADKRINGINRRMHSNNTSGYRGVSETTNGWLATIWNGEKGEFIGYYETAEEAARAWDREAIRLRGEYAVTNFSHLSSELSHEST